jgi:hypothetical protein
MTIVGFEDKEIAAMFSGERMKRIKETNKATRARKQEERRAIKKANHNRRGRKGLAIICTKVNKDQIQRGRDLAQKWKKEDQDVQAED